MNIITIDQHLTLEPLTMHYAPAIFNLVEKNRSYLRAWLPWLDHSKTVQDTEFFIRQDLEQRAKNQSMTFVVCLDRNPLGMVGFKDISMENRRAKIGYWLTEDSQGKGIMTVAVRALLNYGFEDLKLNKIEIEAAVGNNKSNAIPERLGFLKEGVIRDGEWLYDHFVDLAVYGMRAAEWERTTKN